ncbi:MAG: PilN domain-containing protein [Acidobacteriota bacterium]
MPKKSRTGLYTMIVAAAAVLGVLAWHSHLSSAKTAADARLGQLQQQSLALAKVRAEMKQYEEQKSKLEERAQVIEQLRASQKGPVQLLNSVISSMPNEPRLWLTSLDQQEKSVTIEGYAFDVPAIADFIAELGKHAPFQSVELAFWEDRTDSVAFGLNCVIENR